MRLREIRRFVPGAEAYLLWALLKSNAAKAPIEMNQRVLPLWADTLSSWEALHPDDAVALRAPIDALLGCGYAGVAVHRLSEPIAKTDGGGAYLLHHSGLSFAFVGNVRNHATGEVLLATHVGSALIDGRSLTTTNQRNTLDSSLTQSRWVNSAAADEVARVHSQRLPEYHGRLYHVASGADLAPLIDSFTVRTFDEHVARGVYVVSTPQQHNEYQGGVYRV